MLKLMLYTQPDLHLCRCAPRRRMCVCAGVAQSWFLPDYVNYSNVEFDAVLQGARTRPFIKNNTMQVSVNSQIPRLDNSSPYSSLFTHLDSRAHNRSRSLGKLHSTEIMQMARSNCGH